MDIYLEIDLEMDRFVWQKRILQNSASQSFSFPVGLTMLAQFFTDTCLTCFQEAQTKETSSFVLYFENKLIHSHPFLSVSSVHENRLFSFYL